VKDLHGQPRSAEGLPSTTSDAMQPNKAYCSRLDQSRTFTSTIRAGQLLKQPLESGVCMYCTVPGFLQSAGPRELVLYESTVHTTRSSDRGRLVENGSRTGTGGTQSHKSRLLVRSRGQACQPRVTPPTHTPYSPPFWRCSAPVVCLGSCATWKAKSCSPPIGAVPSLPACQPASLPACPPACLPPRPPRCNGSQSRC
jgi:hypothetical protein